MNLVWTSHFFYHKNDEKYQFYIFHTSEEKFYSDKRIISKFSPAFEYLKAFHPFASISNILNIEWDQKIHKKIFFMNWCENLYP